jgi:hypothetical protein
MRKNRDRLHVVGWRNRFLGIDFWAPERFTEEGDRGEER